MPPTPPFPPAAQPISGVKKSSDRIGHGASSRRSLHVTPPSVVRWTQPRTSGEIEPPPTQPEVSSRKKVGPSKTSSMDGRQPQAAPPLVLRRHVIPDARALRLGRKLN